MAFWGTEVKPGKPYTHSFDRVRGRLHISQATLSIGTSVKKSIVQCNVGDKSPVLLCALLPDKSESLQLDLEFEETDDVIFSVIGPRGVHLTGYYVGGCRNSNFQDDTESYGEDVNSVSGESNRCTDEEDEYDDSFINDGEPEALSSSSVSSDGVNEMVHKKKKKDRKGGRKRLKKRYQVVESDDETCSQQNIVNGTIAVEDNDDDDKLPISSAFKSKASTMNMMPELAEEKSNEVTILSLETSNKMQGDDGSIPKTKADSSHIVDPIEKGDAHFSNDETIRKEVPNCNSLTPTAEEIPENQKKTKKKGEELSREANKIDDTLKEIRPQVDEEIAEKSGQNLLVEDKQALEVAMNMTSAVPCSSSLPIVEAAPENGKSKKKRKNHSKKGEVNEADSDRLNNPLKEGEGLKAEAELLLCLSGTSTVPCSSSLPLVEVAPESGKSKKKRKNHSKKGEVSEADSGHHNNPLMESEGQKAEAKLITIDQDVLLRNEHDNDNQTMKEMAIDRLHESILPAVDVGPEMSSDGKRKRNEQTEVNSDLGGSELPVTERDQKLTTEKSCKVVSDQLGVEHQSNDKKPKKKRRKKNKPEETDGNANMEMKEEKNTSVIEAEKNVDARLSEVRTLSNGLIIEDLGMGSMKGRKAASGKKVKIQYTVKLKESGLVIDSNIGKSPFKFRLGDKNVVEGLNIGLEGMRVGAKRRLIIPPSMSSGSEGTGENVPPDSWMVYEVDLVSVH